MRISDWSSDVCSSDLTVVSSLERKRRQPGLATDGPELVGWHQLVGGIQGPQVHFDFIGAASEDGGTAAGTEKPPGVVRSAERRVGKECVRTYRSRWSPCH